MEMMSLPEHRAKNIQPVAVYPNDVHIIQLDDKKVFLVGTAHISQDSVDLVRQVIETEAPDCVCVELDEKRFASLAERNKFAALDLKEIIRKKQLSTLLVNLMLASYQKKLGNQLGVLPGTELMAAANLADSMGIPVELSDRDVRVTLRRAWHATSFFKKGYLLASILTSLFDKTEITEEKIAELKKKDALSELMNELGELMPELKKVVIDERDIFLAEKIKAANGRKIVAVVGAGHVEGIQKVIAVDNSGRMGEINQFPPVSAAWKVVGWGVPAVIIASLVFIGMQKGGAAAGANLMYWILANGVPSAIGAMLAMAHPLTVIGAFVAAPITSLTPVIGAGYVTAFIQVMVRPPVVEEFETVLEDMSTLKGWCRNKLLKVFLAFLLPGFGSMIGTYLGGYEILSNLF
jgi:pheromone shutdown-related protein TraB